MRLRPNSRGAAGQTRPTRAFGFRVSGLPDAPTVELDDPAAAARVNAHTSVASSVDEPYIGNQIAEHLAELITIDRSDERLAAAHEKRDDLDARLRRLQATAARLLPPHLTAGRIDEQSTVGWQRQALARELSLGDELAAADLELWQAADEVQRHLERHTAPFIARLERYVILANAERAAAGTAPLAPLPDDLIDDLIARAMTRPRPVSPHRATDSEETRT